MESYQKQLSLFYHLKTPLATIPFSTIEQICKTILPILQSQDVCLQLSVPVNICGDIHGQFFDLQKIFHRFGTPPQQSYLFLGDYVDRGNYSLEVMLCLMLAKICYPYHVFLLRGNHECKSINEMYGFKEECEKRIQSSDIEKPGVRAWILINQVFQWLPLSAIIEDQILCIHGGLSPLLLEKSMTSSSTTESLLDILNTINRKELATIPDEGLICDLVWADPDKSCCRDFEHNEDRGTSYTFSPNAVNAFCTKYGIKLIVRAHQCVDQGYEFFCDRKLVTIFSAPNYCGNYKNHASILHINSDMNITIKNFK